jgi:hypothetical protein
MIRYRILVATALALVGFAASAIAQNPASKCSNRMIAGTYGYTCSGVAPSPFDPNTTIPVAMMGIVKSDGQGNFYGPSTASLGGLIMPQYATTDGGQKSQVDPDCNGTITYQTWSGPPDDPNSKNLDSPLPIHFVVTDDGNQILGMPTTKGYVVTCRLTRIQFKD